MRREWGQYAISLHLFPLLPLSESGGGWIYVHSCCIYNATQCNTMPPIQTMPFLLTSHCLAYPNQPFHANALKLHKCRFCRSRCGYHNTRCFFNVFFFSCGHASCSYHKTRKRFVRPDRGSSSGCRLRGTWGWILAWIVLCLTHSFCSGIQVCLFLSLV